MSSNQRYTRVDTLEIKALLIKRIGNHRADKYFDQLTRFLTLKTTKSEFDRFCVPIIGRVNVRLHNQLLRSILKNACLGKVPPPFKTAKRSPLSSLNVKVSGDNSSLHSLYGEAFPPSPRKCRSPRDRKFKDRPSPLGPLGKPHSILSDSATELLSLGSRPLASVEEGEEVEQVAGSPGVQSRSPVTAPFGISMNFGLSRKAIPYISAVNSTQYRQTCHRIGELPDTRLLRDRMQQKLQEEGMRVSVDCANVLNNALDTYLKRLIEPCMSVSGSRSRSLHDSSAYRLVPGSNEVSSVRYRQRISEPRFCSMLDFRVSVGSNPQILGPDWAVQLEKVNLGSF